MDIEFLNKKYNNSLFITSKNNKEIILKEAFKKSKILQFKLVDIKEAETLFLPYINPICEYLIYKELNNRTLAKNIYKSLKYIKKEEYDSKKLKQIKDIYEELKNKSYIKEKEIIDFKEIISTEKNLDYLNNNIKYIKLSDLNIKQKQLDVIKFTNIEEEISYMLNKVANLIDKGVDSKLIKIYAPNIYKDSLSLISKYYNLDFSLDTSVNIKVFPKVGELISYLKLNNTLDIFEFKDINKIPIDVQNKILAVINKNVEQNDLDYTLKAIEEIKINDIVLKNSLKIHNILNFDFNKENINIILGFDNLNFINILKDDKFLNDEELNEIGLSTSFMINIENVDKVKQILKYVSSTNYILSFCSNINSIETNVNSLLDKSFINIKKYNQLNDIQYSYDYDKLLLKIEENKFSKYNLLTDNYYILKNNINYEKNIDKTNKVDFDIDNFKRNKKISSTMLETYYKCPFSFYIKYVLNIKKSSKNRFNLDLGIYIHDMLENLLLNDDKDTEKLSEEIILNNNLFNELNPNKVDFIIFKVNNYIKNLIDVINAQIEKEKFNIESLEEEIDCIFNGYELVGKIDKVLRYKDKFIVIDYKTGDSNLSFDNLELGLNMQNLIYFILLEYKYKDVEFVGTYRYKVAPKIVDQEKFKEPKRIGYTKKDLGLLKEIDIDNYEGLNTSKGGFNSKSKVLTEEEYLSKKEIVKNNINNFINNIEKKKEFKIQDMKIKNESISCKYCDYNNICFKSKKDIIYK